MSTVNGDKKKVKKQIKKIKRLSSFFIIDIHAVRRQTLHMSLFRACQQRMSLFPACQDNPTYIFG